SRQTAAYLGSFGVPYTSMDTGAIPRSAACRFIWANRAGVRPCSDRNRSDRFSQMAANVALPAGPVADTLTGWYPCFSNSLNLRCMPDSDSPRSIIQAGADPRTQTAA